MCQTPPALSGKVDSSRTSRQSGVFTVFLKINIVFWGNSEVIAWLIFASARLIIYTSGPGLYRACPTAVVRRFYAAAAAAAPLLALAEVTARTQHHILGEKFPQ